MTGRPFRLWFGRCAAYRNDGAFLEIAVSSLAQLGDARALPVLRELTSGRHYRLMKRRGKR